MPNATAIADPPVGAITPYGYIIDANSPPPDGWLLCDGKAVSRAKYSQLFGAIGTLHGSGDGTSTFNLPDYRGRFLRGRDDGAGRDPDARGRQAPLPGGGSGDAVGSVQSRATAAPANAFVTTTDGSHTHSVPHLPTDCSWYPISGSHYAAWNSGPADTSTDGAHTHAVDGGDVDTCPVNVAFNHIIFSNYFSGNG